MSVSRETIQKNMCPVLIETGTYHGDFIQSIKDLGFETIISIEVSMECCKIAWEKFARDDNVFVLYGDSVNVLDATIKTIKDKMIFVLDAHCCDWGSDTRTLDEKDKSKLTTYPIIRELEIIKSHSRKNHTIIIDDVRLFESHFSTTLEEVKQVLLSINSNYNITLVDGLSLDGSVISNDVLIAKE